MRTLRYSNAVLTVIAVLLTLNLYVLARRDTRRLGAVGGDRGPRRRCPRRRALRPSGSRRSIQALTDLKLSVEQINTTLTGGALRVKIEGAADQSE